MEKILRFRELAPYTGGVAKSTVWHWVRGGTFPPPVPLGENSVGWLVVEIERWQQKRIAERDSRLPGTLRVYGRKRKS